MSFRNLRRITVLLAFLFTLSPKAQGIILSPEQQQENRFLLGQKQKPKSMCQPAVLCIPSAQGYMDFGGVLHLCFYIVVDQIIEKTKVKMIHVDAESPQISDCPEDIWANYQQKVLPAD